MATYYVDLENGNDANNGTTFALRKKTINSITTPSAGDTIRVMASKSATSIGSATWTSSNGSPSSILISNATNATPIVITTTTNHGLSNGDTVSIQNVNGNTNANGMYEITNASGNTLTLVNSQGNGTYSSGGAVLPRNANRIWLPAALTKDIASYGNLSRTVWTASTNVTTALTTSAYYKSTNQADQFTVNSSFTTGKIAYKTISPAMDLSGYQQISFWIGLSLGTVGSGSLQIRLCSDTLGATAVNTFSIPALQLSTMHRITLDLGTNLGSSIQSIAVYRVTGSGAITFYLDNIFAVKAASANDSINLNSLLSQASSGDNWYPIQSIVGQRVIFESYPGNTNINALTYHYGTAGSVTTYKMDPIRLASVANGATFPELNYAGSVNGTSDNLITFSGGWNRTDMSTQTGETWVIGPCSFGYALTTTNAVDYIKFEKFGLASMTGPSPYGTNLIYNIAGESSLTYGYSVTAANTTSTLTLGTVTAVNNAIRQTQSSASTTVSYIGKQIRAYNYTVTGGTVVITEMAATWNGSPGTNNNGIIQIYKMNGGNGYIWANGSNSGVTIYELGTWDCTPFPAGAISIGSSTGVVPMTIYNGTIINATSIVNAANVGYQFQLKLYNIDVSGASIVSNINNMNQYDPNSYVTLQNTTQSAKYTYYGECVTDTSVRHTASGYSWRMSPKNAYRDDQNLLTMKLASVAVSSGTLVTVKAWMRRDNTGLNMRLRLPLRSYTTQASAITSSMTASADTWEEVTLTFTPSEATVVEIYADAIGGTTYNGYVDDVTITQA